DVCAADLEERSPVVRSCPGRRRRTPPLPAGTAAAGARGPRSPYVIRPPPHDPRRRPARGRLAPDRLSAAAARPDGLADARRPHIPGRRPARLPPEPRRPGDAQPPDRPPRPAPARP